jgi:hypothetical protein
MAKRIGRTGAMATFICKSNLANTYHASAFKLWTLLEAPNSVHLSPHPYDKELVSRAPNDRSFELHFESDPIS